MGLLKRYDFVTYYAILNTMHQVEPTGTFTETAKRGQDSYWKISFETITHWL